MNSNYRPQGFKMLPEIVKNLLIINGLMFFATFVMTNTMGVDLTRILGLHYFSSEFFKPYQLVTHVFMHGSFMHLFLNMFALWMFGNVLENHWGPKKFLIYYFVTAFGAAGLHIFVTWFGVHGLEQGIEALRVSGTPEAFQTFITGYVPDGLKSQFVEVRSAWESNPGSSQLREQAYSYANQLYSMEVNTPVVGASGAVFGLLL
ncbi:MAG: membrane associated rhomboid family serine protease, partial [Sphingobacteriales bacterium]